MVVICVCLSNFLTYEFWDKSDGREQPHSNGLIRWMVLVLYWYFIGTGTLLVLFTITGSSDAW
jgi:hypothetical protein